MEQIEQIRPRRADNAHYLESQARRESNARTYPRKIPIAIVRAEGACVTDADGKTYYDCLAGAGTLALGHNHPVVVDAIRRVLASGAPLHTLDLTTPVKEKFVDDVFATLPKSFASRARIQFCGPSGSDAVEAALKLVKIATGNRCILSFHGGYHGMTHGSLALMGNLHAKSPVPGLMAEAHFLPYPYSYRCPFGVGGTQGHELSSRYIENVLDDPESGIVAPAGMILEPVQGEGGVIPAPVEWLREIRRITAERRIPLILDEVQTGLGRTGKLYGFEHAGIIPDVLVLSKALGGSLPISVVIYDESLDQWSPGAHAGTFRGNQLAMAAGSATIEFIIREGLLEAATRIGARLMGRLERLRHDFPVLGEVRGRGLMVGVEVVDATVPGNRLGSCPANPGLARRLQAECVRLGLIVELGGRHGSVVRFLPPLIVTEGQIDEICGIFREALEAALRREGANHGKAKLLA